MFCSGCGKVIPDGSAKCPDCGKEFTADPVSVEIQPAAPKSTTDVNVGAFIQEFFKNPIEAVISRSQDSYWLWGLISLAGFAVVYFLRYAFDEEVGGASAFALMFSLLCGLAALVFSLFLFQGIFKLEKKSLPSIISAVGLSMVPMIPIIIFGSIMDFLFFTEASFISFFLNPLLGLGYLFSSIILVMFYLDEDEKSYVKSMMMVVVSYAIFIFVQCLFSAFVWNSIL
jgi:hypothetical protein